MNTKINKKLRKMIYFSKYYHYSTFPNRGDVQVHMKRRKQIYVLHSFFLHQNQNIFFSNIGNQNIFLEKNHNPPLQVKWSFPYIYSTYLNKERVLMLCNVMYISLSKLPFIISKNLWIRWYDVMLGNISKKSLNILH